MFGSAPYGASAYSKVGLETDIASASPHKLIILLFEGATVAVSNALQNMKSGNVAEKGKFISKSILIIESGLRSSLDKEAGGEIASNLDSLYDYMSKRLLQANLNNQPELLEEVQSLLLELKGAWEAIADKSNSSPKTSSFPQSALVIDPLAPRMSSLVKA